MSTYSLDGSWQFRLAGTPKASAPKNLKLKNWMPCAMPGTLHYALQKLDKISDPFYGRNELEMQWVDEQNWEIERELTVSSRDFAKSRQELIFDSIDTVAEIFLNGHKVGQSVNMFRQVVCDVKGILRSGENSLRILLKSPTAYAAAQAKKYHDRVDRDVPWLWQTGESRAARRAWIRKIQCHFGWDWGLYLAVSGLAMSARLECSDAPRFASMQTTQTHRGPVGKPNRVDLQVTVRLLAVQSGSGVLHLTCDDETRSLSVRLKPGENIVRVPLSIKHPKLWWPAGQGSQPLYDLRADWEDAGGSRARMEKRIGLRTTELVTKKDRTPEGRPGESFYFKVNGRPIYAKGTNWIPVDAMVDRATPNVYRHLLKAMVESNMNMVRVWGGGWYEKDLLYDLCDEMGILVWLDFKMGCFLYPDTKEFLAELTEEVRYQVRRLFDHPSLVLLCGDNENSVAVQEWFKKYPRWKEYQEIYANTMRTMKRVCEKEDPTRPFWLSSPSYNVINGPHPNNTDQGDTHYWTVWHGGKPFSNYLEVRPRFCSEFGFQSFPEPRTLAAVVPPKEQNSSSWVMEHHQRSPDGNMLITNTIARELPIPEGFENYCWASQINQATAMRTAVEHWRRLKPWCMGTLYWQLNDLWPVASWSSMDYHGRWKALQHEVGRFYAPLLASITQEKDQLSIWATSDVPKPLHLKGSLELYTWAGKRVAKVPLAASLKAQESRAVRTLSLKGLLKGLHPREVCCFVELGSKDASSSNFATLVPWKWAPLVKPIVRTQLKQGHEGVELTVRSSQVVPYFHADISGLEGHFAGDWQVLKPGKTYRLPWVPHVERGGTMPSLGEAKKRLKTLNLYELSTKS